MEKLIIILVLTILIVSCKNDCDSVSLGFKDISEDSKAYVPLINGSVVMFKNQLGEEIQFVNERIEEKFNLCIRSYCEPLDPYKSAPCEYYEAMGIRNVLKTVDDSIYLDVVVSTDNFEMGEEKMYELLSIYFSKTGFLANGQKAIHSYFESLTLEMVDDRYSDLLFFAPTLTLNDTNYMDVYHTNQDEEHAVYLSRGKGVVAIKLKGQLYFLVE